MKGSLSWLVEKTKYLASLYVKILSYVIVAFEKCVEPFISEQSQMELRNDVDGLVTCFSDIILFIRLSITCTVNYVAMVILSISDVLYPAANGSFDRKMFWQATSIDITVVKFLPLALFTQRLAGLVIVTLLR